MYTASLDCASNGLYWPPAQAKHEPSTCAPAPVPCLPMAQLMQLKPEFMASLPLYLPEGQSMQVAMLDCLADLGSSI